MQVFINISSGLLAIILFILGITVYRDDKIFILGLMAVNMFIPIAFEKLRTK